MNVLVVKKETREEKVVTTKETEFFHLVIDRETAEAIQAVFYRVGGDPDGYRGLVQKIHMELLAAGLHPEGTRPNALARGNIMFEG